jgi:protein SCO1/2
VASLVILVAGGAGLWWATDGFRALTSEQARRRAVAAAPRVIPTVELEDQDGRPFTLESYRGRPVVVDFVYTRCRSVCPLLSDALQRVDHLRRARSSIDSTVPALLSITFDSGDTPADLRAYAGHYNADGRSWRFARAHRSADLSALLRAFDIVVISDGRGDFQHNAALHVLDDRGRLARVLDLETPPAEILKASHASGQ